MIAYCGMNCTQCECFLATKENNDTKREEVAKKWSIQYNADITTAQINCTGCKSTGVQFFFTENACPIRKCNSERSNAHCAECNEYQCETLKDFIKMAPQIGEALENLRTKKK